MCSWDDGLRLTGLSPLQCVSTDPTSSCRCTRPRGSPGTPCAETTGARATGGQRARTWATGEFRAPASRLELGTMVTETGRNFRKTSGSCCPSLGVPAHEHHLPNTTRCVSFPGLLWEISRWHCCPPPQHPCSPPLRLSLATQPCLDLHPLLVTQDHPELRSPGPRMQTEGHPGEGLGSGCLWRAGWGRSAGTDPARPSRHSQEAVKATECGSTDHQTYTREFLPALGHREGGRGEGGVPIQSVPARAPRAPLGNTGQPPAPTRQGRVIWLPPPLAWGVPVWLLCNYRVFSMCQVSK